MRRRSFASSNSTTTTAASSSGRVEEIEETGEEDYFRVLGIARSFTIDEEALKTNYRNLMAEHHPDKLQQQHSGNKSSMEQQRAVVLESRTASTITRAYDTLRHPHPRAVHLVQLLLGHDGTMDSFLEETTRESAPGERLGMEFLMEVMELRETIEKYVLEEDKIGMEEAMQENKRRMDETCTELAELLDPVALRQKENSLDREKALELIAKLQYWNRIDETLRDQIEI